ncbi:MAG: MmcQ/YjbR family DNA-binding protein [Spirosomataceae bacterium]|jgi:predicted DNA-binding protein (MmcQ/YjbR family)
MNTSEFESLCLSLPEAEKGPHFENVAFKVKGKIFATLNAKECRATLKFKPEEQDIYLKINPEAIFPVPNKWGKHGWTHLLYGKLSHEITHELLKIAYVSVAPPKLAQFVKLE